MSLAALTRRHNAVLTLCVALAIAVTVSALGGFAAGVLSAPAPPLRCALLTQR